MRSAHALDAVVGRLEEEFKALVELCTSANYVQGVNVAVRGVHVDRLAALCECAERSILTAETTIREEIRAMRDAQDQLMAQLKATHVLVTTEV